MAHDGGAISFAGGAGVSSLSSLSLSLVVVMAIHCCDVSVLRVVES